MENSVNEENRSWLQRLKEESWEAEVLISTVAIFGSIQLFKIIDWTTNIAINLLPPSQYKIGYSIIYVGLVAISILTSMFVIHFILRAYWVGLVGLNSVFPDYSVEDSAYSKVYTEKMLSILPKLGKTIKTTDELCSVIFSAAFAMLFTYAYMSVIIGLILLVYNKLSIYFSDFILLIPLKIIGFIFGLQLVLWIIGNIKFFKSNEKIQTLLFEITKVVYLLTLGPLYKYIVQVSMTFASNYKKKKYLIGLILSFIFVGFMISFFKFADTKIPYLITQEAYFDSTRMYSGYYSSRHKEDDFLVSPQIDTDIIESKIMRLFIPVYSYEQGLVKDICGIRDKSLTRKQKKEWRLSCYNKYHEIYLNEQRLVDPEFMKYNMPETEQFGIITYLNLENVDQHSNSIKVVKTYSDTMQWEIPFQYLPR